MYLVFYQTIPTPQILKVTFGLLESCSKEWKWNVNELQLFTIVTTKRNQSFPQNNIIQYKLEGMAISNFQAIPGTIHSLPQACNHCYSHHYQLACCLYHCQYIKHHTTTINFNIRVLLSSGNFSFLLLLKIQHIKHCRNSSVARII